MRAILIGGYLASSNTNPLTKETSMPLHRRDFLKLAGATAAATGLAGLGQLSLGARPVHAHAATLKIQGAKEVFTICPFCSVSCGIVGYEKDGKLVSTEGDADHPINQGSLCAKGAAMLSITNAAERLKKPLYRAPFSKEWVEKDWDFCLNRIAQLVKDTRDKDFIQKNAKGEVVNRLDSMVFMGSSHADNEECALIHQFVRGLGITHMDHQARI